MRLISDIREQRLVFLDERSVLVLCRHVLTETHVVLTNRYVIMSVFATEEGEEKMMQTFACFSAEGEFDCFGILAYDSQNREAVLRKKIPTQKR